MIGKIYAFTVFLNDPHSTTMRLKPEGVTIFHSLTNLVLYFRVTYNIFVSNNSLGVPTLLNH